MKVLATYCILLLAVSLSFIAVNAKQVGQQQGGQEIENSNEEPVLDNGAREIVNINGSFYYIGPTALKYTAYNALLICNDIGMRLISLQTNEKYDAVIDYMFSQGHKSYFWSSGVRYSDRNFVWSGTGEIFTYTNWWGSDPNESNEEVDVCVGFYSTGLWEDFPCAANTLSVICEQ